MITKKTLALRPLRFTGGYDPDYDALEQYRSVIASPIHTPVNFDPTEITLIIAKLTERHTFICSNDGTHFNPCRVSIRANSKVYRGDSHPRMSTLKYKDGSFYPKSYVQFSITDHPPYIDFVSSAAPSSTASRSQHIVAKSPKDKLTPYISTSPILSVAEAAMDHTSSEDGVLLEINALALEVLDILQDTPTEKSMIALPFEVCLDIIRSPSTDPDRDLIARQRAVTGTLVETQLLGIIPGCFVSRYKLKNNPEWIINEYPLDSCPHVYLRAIAIANTVLGILNNAESAIPPRLSRDPSDPLSDPYATLTKRTQFK